MEELSQRQEGTTRRPHQLTFISNDPILANGVYRVIHHQHRLPAEVTLLQGHEFPNCSRCQEDVLFEFLRPVTPAVGFRIVLYSLPETRENEGIDVPHPRAA